MTGVEDIQVDARRIVHHVGVMLAGKNVTGTAHVGRQLIDFVESTVDRRMADILATQIPDHEVIGQRVAILRVL